MRLIDADALKKDLTRFYDNEVTAKQLIDEQPTIKQEPCEDAISRQAVIEVLNKMDRYVADELTLCDTERKFPQNEVFIVDDVYEEIVEQLPPVTPAEKVSSSENPNEQIPVMYYPQVEGITPTVVEPSYNSINALSNSENPNKWIPVNQPPKASGRYIVTRHFFDNDFVEMANYGTDLRKVDKYDFPKRKAGWYNYDSEYGYYEVDDIVAWMPIEPYKASPTGAEVG